MALCTTSSKQQMNNQIETFIEFLLDTETTSEVTFSQAILKKQKSYRETNREVILKNKKISILCETCKCSITKTNLAEHRKTKKHINNLQLQ